MHRGHTEHIRLDTGLDFKSESQQALSELLDKVAIVALSLGSLGTLASVWRVTHAGWHINIVCDLFFFAALVILILLRRRLPLTAVLLSMMGLVLLSAVANFATIGLITISFLMLGCCCMILAIAFGVRAGTGAMGIFVACVLLVYAAFRVKLLPPIALAESYPMAPQTWTTQIVGFVAYTTAMLAALGSLQSRLTRSLGRISEQAVELQQREQSYRMLAEHMRDVLFRQDMDMNILYVSPSVESVFGYTVEEAMQLQMSQYLTPESLAVVAKSFSQHLQRCRQDDVRIPPLLLEYVRKDGSTLWCDMYPSFVRDDGGNIIGSLGLIVDVSDRIRAEKQRGALEEQLRQSEKLRALGQLAGGVAHDFNNQLVGITACAELIREEYPGDKQLQEYADTILQPAQRARELTAKLLAFARKGSYEHVRFNLHDIIDEVIAILQRSVDKRIGMVRHYEAAAAWINGDASQMQNAVLNVAINARDAMPGGGQLVFSTRRIDTAALPPQQAQASDCTGSIELCISDTGIGMTQEVKQRLFEPFFTTKPPGQGSGMGLSAVLGTVEAHGGRVHVQSAQSSGTTFTIVLPAAAQPADPPPVPAATTQPLRGSGRIMLVDDEHTVRLAISRVLEHLGYEVHGCATGLEAIEYYKQHRESIDLVLLDLVLPHMGGAEILERLRALSPQLRAIMLSGFSDDQDAQRLLERGACAMLRKPFTAAELSQTIARCIAAAPT